MVYTDKNLAVLVGNGLSIAFNEKLDLKAITQEVLKRFEEANGDDVVKAIQEIAERALPEGASGADDFEHLVGAFGAESRTLGLLETLANLTAPADTKLLESISQVSNFAEQVQDTGISHVLQVIAERSHGRAHDSEHLYNLIGEIVGSFKGKVVFSNLNYDTLLLAALLEVCRSELADMGHGWRQATVTVGNGEQKRKINVPALRTDPADFPPDKRVQLLHIHGSLAYWASLDGKVHAKMPIELLRGEGQWDAVRGQTTDVRPVVVLANHRDKASHISEYPFKLAYEMFADSLTKANNWLIIGYSFRDDPVNSTLRKEFIERTTKPHVLVVTYGESPSRLEIERALGWGAEDGLSVEWLTIYREGADGFEESHVWRNFVNK